MRKTGARFLMEDIIRQIEDGRIRPGDPIRSAKDLAVEYKISYVTAHNAVARLARNGYCVRISGRGTFVSDKPPRVAAVGIPAYFQANPFLAHMVEALTMGAAVRGIQAVVGRAVRTSDFVDRLLANGVNAMIRFPGSAPGDDITEPKAWELLRKRGMRTVMVNDFWTDGGPLPHVCTDEGAGVNEMMDHLISLGHKKISLVQEMAEGTRFRAIEAYGAALREHGLQYDPANVIYLFTTEKSNHDKAVRMTVDEMLGKGTAAIVIYDLYALDLMKEIERRGLSCGRDFSIAGFDGIHEAEIAGLTTISHPVDELVRVSFELLQSGARDASAKVRVRPVCIFRSSTGPRKK